MTVRGFLMAMVSFVAFLLFLGNQSIHAEKVRGVTDNTITIGSICDMTGPANAILGALGMGGGIRNCFRQINDEGGINGRKVKLVMEDDRYSIPGALSGFKKLFYKDRMLALCGVSGTPQTTALLPNIMDKKVPVITISLVERMVTPYKRYIFIPSCSYEDHIKVLVDYIMQELKAKNPRIALVSLDSVDFRRAALAATKKGGKKYGFDVVAVDVVPLGAIDATTQVLHLKRVKADHIIVHCNIGSAVAFLRDARKYSLKAKFFGGYYSCDEDVVKLVGKAANNLWGVHTFSSWFEDNPGMKNLRGATMGYEPKPKTRNRFYVQGWVMASICAEGMRKAGKDLNHETLVDALEKFKDFDTQGLTAPITYSSTSHKPKEYTRVYKANVEKGVLEPVTDWRKPSY